MWIARTNQRPGAVPVPPAPPRSPVVVRRGGPLRRTGRPGAGAAHPGKWLPVEKNPQPQRSPGLDSIGVVEGHDLEGLARILRPDTLGPGVVTDVDDRFRPLGVARP